MVDGAGDWGWYSGPCRAIALILAIDAPRQLHRLFATRHWVTGVFNRGAPFWTRLHARGRAGTLFERGGCKWMLSLYTRQNHLVAGGDRPRRGGTALVGAVCASISPGQEQTKTRPILQSTRAASAAAAPFEDDTRS